MLLVSVVYSIIHDVPFMYDLVIARNWLAEFLRLIFVAFQKPPFSMSVNLLSASEQFQMNVEFVKMANARSPQSVLKTNQMINKKTRLYYLKKLKILMTS